MKTLKILVIAFILIGCVNAFSQNNNVKLEGTAWEVQPRNTPDGMLEYLAFVFHPQGVAELIVFTVSKDVVYIPPHLQYNSENSSYADERGRTVVVPGIPPSALISSGSLPGKYQQKGNSVYMDFSDFIYEATIIGNQMKGTILYKRNNQKDELSITKLSGSSNNSTNSSASTSVPTASLSMSERLPKQLGQFKQTSLTNYCNSNPNPDKKPYVTFSKDPLKDCDKNDFEVLDAKYQSSAEGSEVYIVIRKYENSAKATESMMKLINSNSSNKPIKREFVRNRAGQTVGEMFIWSPKGVLFTFGEYYYWIVSLKEDVQEILKLLPIESPSVPLDNKLISSINKAASKEQSPIGTYIATGSEVFSDSLTRSSLNREGITIKITIKSVDKDGNVKADVTIQNREGTLSGKITSDGKLQLEGGLIGDKGRVFQTKLSATVVTENGSLIEGKYLSTTDIFTMKGQFNLAVKKEDE